MFGIEVKDVVTEKKTELMDSFKKIIKDCSKIDKNEVLEIIRSDEEELKEGNLEVTDDVIKATVATMAIQQAMGVIELDFDLIHRESKQVLTTDFENELFCSIDEIIFDI